jgi:hypothetical protein
MWPHEWLIFLEGVEGLFFLRDTKGPWTFCWWEEKAYLTIVVFFGEVVIFEAIIHWIMN